MKRSKEVTIIVDSLVQSGLLEVSEDIRGTPNKSTEYHTITRNEVV